MTILLQNQKTGCFFQAPDAWVPHPAEAHSFLSWAEARSTQEKYQLQDVHMVFRFEHEAFFLQVPLECRAQGRMAG